jgi:hypothetical protein
MSRTARYICSGVVAILLVAALAAGVYVLLAMRGADNFRVRLLFAFAPAAMLGWLLAQAWPRPDGAKEAAVPVAPEPPAPADEPEDPYTFIGSCSPGEAEALLAKLEQNKVRFLIDVDRPRLSASGRFANVSPDPVKIFVHNDDMPGTETILASLGRNLGGTL